MDPVHMLILIALLSVLGGRALEMMVGVAKVSDLTVFWVSLGLFAALPGAMHSPNPARGQSSESLARSRPSLDRSALLPMPGVSRVLWLWKMAVVICLIGTIVNLTWMNAISYPRAAVQAGEVLEYFRQRDFPSTLIAIDRAIELAPDVPIYHN